MINFFRKIRQNLLSENKFNKYLIYAIGEIILVVIGILIALQINNWNIRTQNLAEFDRNLENLIQDVRDNNIQLDRLIKDNHGKIESATKILDRYEQNGQMTSKEFLKLQIPVNYEVNFIINRNGIDETLSSTIIKSEESESIRNQINQYLLKANYIKIQDDKEAELQENMEKELVDTRFLDLWKLYRHQRYLSNTYKPTADFDFQKIMELGPLKNILLRVENVRPESNESYKQLIEEGENLLSHINLYQNLN